MTTKIDPIPHSSETHLDSIGWQQWFNKLVLALNSFFPTVVPYTGATSNINLGTHSLIANTLTLSKVNTGGILVDETTPTYGWRDILGQLIVKVPAGAHSPAEGTIRGGQCHAYYFAAGDKVDFIYHIPHDYVIGTDVFLHVHFAHNGTVISGNAVMDFFLTYAKGHQQAIFPAEKNATLTYNTVNITTTPQYEHMLKEIQISIAGGSATQLDTSLLEPDGMILCNGTFTTIPTITGGSPNNPFVLQVDIHYQSTNIGTKEKAPNFYI